MRSTPKVPVSRRRKQKPMQQSRSARQLALDIARNKRRDAAGADEEGTKD